MDPFDSVVWGYRFTEEGTAQELKGDALRSAVTRGDTWLWLHFDLASPRADEAIASIPALPEEARRVLLGSDDHQRIVACGHVIAGVVADFERAETMEVRQMSRWHFCMAPHLFISARRRPLLTLNRLQQDLKGGRRFPTAAALFHGIIHAFASAMGTLVEQFADQLDGVEDELLDARETGDYEALGRIRRSAVRLHRQALPLRNILHHLLEERPDWFDDSAADDCAQVSRRIDSLCADLQSLQERAHALQDEFTARQNDETNRRLTMLSVVATLLMPPSLIAGIYGMNVDGIPLKDGPWAFPISMAILAGSVVIGLIALRRVKLL